jgi:hypothetical protein
MDRENTGRLLVALALLPCAAAAEGLLAVDNPARNAGAAGGYASLEVFQASDRLSMRGDGKSWLSDSSPRGGTNRGLLAARVEAGAQRDGYRLGVLYRADAMAQANRDTADLVRQYNYNTGYDPGRTYQVDYRIRGFEADGLRLSKSFQGHSGGTWQLDWGVGASWLHGKRVKVETASGQVRTLSTQNFDANVSLDSMDSKVDTSGGGRFNPPFGAHPSLSGQGAALDLGAVWRRQDGLRLEAAVNDLAGRMVWKNLPDYAANYNTATSYYDSLGYVHFNPLLAAQSCYRDFTQTLDPKLRLAVGYPLGAFEMRAAGSYTRGSWFPELGLAYHAGSRWSVSADYDLRFKTVMISLRHPLFQLGVNGSRIPGASGSATSAGAGESLARTAPFSQVAGSTARCGLAQSGRSST